MEALSVINLEDWRMEMKIVRKRVICFNGFGNDGISNAGSGKGSAKGIFV